MQVGQDEQAVRAAYDEVADTYADRFPSTEPEQPVDLAMIEHFASLLPGTKRVVDAGCGAGRLLPMLNRLAGRVVGVDLSRGMIRRAQLDHPTFSTTVASLTRLPYEGAAFDGYFSWYSTIHTGDDDMARIFREARRVLRPGGAILVAFQSGRGIRDASGGYRRLGHDIILERHNRTSTQIAAWLAAAGLSEVARLERGPIGAERDGQAVVIAMK